MENTNTLVQKQTQRGSLFARLTGSARTYSQADVDKIVARAKELGASKGLSYKQGHLRLSTYSEPHGAEALAMLLVNGWHGKYDLIYATQALIEFLSPNTGLDGK